MVSDSMQSLFYKENKGTMQNMLAFVKPTPNSVFALFTKHSRKALGPFSTKHAKKFLLIQTLDLQHNNSLDMFWLRRNFYLSNIDKFNHFCIVGNQHGPCAAVCHFSL